MKKKIQLLMVDDHPFILQAYKNTLNGFKKDDYEIIISEANSGQSGYDVIVNSTVDFDVALLDISLPTYMEKNIESNLFRYDYKIDILLASGCEYDLCITVIFDPYTGQVNKVNTHDYLLLCLWVQSRPVVTFWLW